MGICILAGVLIGANILSEERSLTTGEVRKAIAISCISVFFGVLAFGENVKTGNDILKAILENFWWIIVTVIGFYFSGRQRMIQKKIDETRLLLRPTLHSLTLASVLSHSDNRRICVFAFGYA